MWPTMAPSLATSAALRQRAVQQSARITRAGFPIIWLRYLPAMQVLYLENAVGLL